jgi:hypothetical protein
MRKLKKVQIEKVPKSSKKLKQAKNKFKKAQTSSNKLKLDIHTFMVKK